MATTFVDYTGDGNATKAFSFPSIKEADVKVEVDGVVKTTSTHYNITSYTTTGGGNVVFTSGNIPASPAAIRIYRDTDVDTAKATYTAGSSVKAGDLNNNQTQLLYAAQEEQNQTVTTSKIKDGAVTSAKIKDGAIVNADINASAAIEGSKLQASSGSVAGTMSAANFTKLAGIETAATADQTDAEIRTAVEAATDSNVFTDADHSKLNGIEAGATADQTISEIKSLIAGSPLDASHLAANSVTSSELAANSVTTSEIADAELTTLAGMQSGTASKLADSTALTADIADLNQIDGLTKQTTISDSDASFPTSGAVVDYVTAQIDEIGGFEAIANEVSFPNTQPGAGVAISIADAAGIVVNGSGVSTTGRTVGGSTVTINGIASNFNSSTVASGIRFIVTSTGSGQVYNYHKATLAENDLVSLSGDINDFNERYRVGSSNPTSALDNGDLFFNTSTGKMLVYNGTNSAWEEVQSIGNFFISTFSEAFDGSRTQFTLSNAPTTVQQIILSLNGVVQKPGTAFTLSSSTVTLASAPASGTEYFAVVMGSTVNIGTPSNNTVTTAILQNGSVTTAKITDANVTTAKIADDAVTDAKLANSINSAISANTAKTSNATHTGDVTGATSLTIANDAVTTAKIADDAVTDAKLANSINSAISANTAKTSNATHTGEVTGGTALTIADNVVDEANLKVSNSPTNGYFLSAQSGNTGGLTWAEVSAGVTSDGQNNTVAGTNAGDSFTGTDANNNTLIGYVAGTAITTGDDNTSVGAHSLGTNNTGSSNSAFGQASLNLNTTGSSNTAYGQGSLRTNTTASNNTAVGKDALKLNTTGTANVAMGKDALQSNTTGSYNTALGKDAVQYNTTADYNTGVGYQALKVNTTGTNLVGVGYNALTDNTTGSKNVAVGREALANNTTADNNTAIGDSAMESTTTGSVNTAVGKSALKVNTSGTYNAAFGAYSVQNNTTGSYNTGFGYGTLADNTTGYSNTAVGYHAGSNITTAWGCTLVGNNAGLTITTGQDNTVVGHSAAYDLTTATDNVVLGVSAGGDLTTGSRNVIAGVNAARYTTTGNNNVVFGINAASNLSTGTSNVCIGQNAANYVTAFTTNTESIIIGSHAYPSGTGNTRETVIGYNVGGQGSNTFKVRASSGAYQSNNSSSWSTTSDERIKKNIVDNNSGLDKINQIQVRNFEYRTEDEITDFENPKAARVDKEGTQIGVIAQEIEKILPELVMTQSTGVKTVDPTNLTWYLLNAVKELSAKVTALEAK